MVEYYTWADALAKELSDRDYDTFSVHGMWTPSGFFHIGNARPELFTPALAFNALKDAGIGASHNFIIDDFDDFDKVPEGFDKSFEKYLGKPLREVPSPSPEFSSWAEYFMDQIVSVCKEFGINPNIYSSYESYKQGKYDQAIRIALDNVEKIKEIWKKQVGVEKPKDWLPVMPVCEKCGKSATTRAISWDGEYVEYACDRDRDYAKSCGHTGRIKPIKGNVKLPWRVHWPATWYTFGVCFESGGKDHFTPGGSVDTGKEMAKQVFGVKPPVLYGTELVQLGKEKMSGSKGNLISMKEWLNFAEPELLRFMYISYQPGKVIEFDLKSNKFSLLVDRYDQAERCFFGQPDENLTQKRVEQLKRIYELSQIEIPKKLPYQIPYSLAGLLGQIYSTDKEIFLFIEKLDNITLSETDKEKISKRVRLAKYWIEKYNPEGKIQVTETINNEFIESLSENEKNFLRSLKDIKDMSEDDLQQFIYTKGKENNLSGKEMFGLLYRLLINKKQGPRMSTLILAIGIDKFKELISEI